MRFNFQKFGPGLQRVGAALLATWLSCGLLTGASYAQQTAASVQPEDAQRAALVAAGKRIYRQGLDFRGLPIKGIGPGGTSIEGQEAACVNCHRRSGYGGSEGKYTIRPVTATALFAEQAMLEHAPRIKAQLGARLRPAYTPETLTKAIRTGVDSSGKQLEPVMPRFQLGDRDMQALTAYLETLSAHDSPGVGEEEIHFATVIQPGVSPERRRAMLDIMQAFVKDKTSNVRSNEQRREAGVMRMNRSYRKWVLHVWELNGGSETWDAQLQKYYDQQPVFALVGGIGHASWQPIHTFAERLEIPSLFAQADLPQLAGANNYNVYFSRGLTLDAEVLAKFLGEQEAAASGLVQVYRPSERGRVISAAFKAALPPSLALQNVVLEGAADESFWRKVLASKPAAVVLWLDANDLETLPADFGGGIPVYGSYAMGSDKSAGSPAPMGQLQWVYPSDLPPRHESRLLRTKLWLHNKSIALTTESTQVNTLFAMAIVSDVMGHIMDSFSRDFLVERVEHAVAQTTTPSFYQSISLGPGQRFAAKGSTIVQWGEKGPVKAVSGWIVP